MFSPLLRIGAEMMLLKEMGTVRNKRQLKEQNDKLAARCKATVTTLTTLTG